MKRRSKRFYGYGVISDNIWNFAKAAASKVLPAAATAIGSKVGSQIANKIVPTRANRDNQVKEAMELITKNLQDEPTREEILSRINLASSEDYQ